MPALLDHAERLGRGSLTPKALREQLLSAVRKALPFDGHVFALTDPVTRVGTSPLADIPGLAWPDLPHLIRWRYLTRINRWTDLLDAGVGASSLLQVTAGRPEMSPLWQHALRGLGVVDTAMVPFGDRYGCWGFVELWRTSAPFTDSEVALLGDLPAVVAPGLRAAVARTFVDPADQLLPVGPAVVVLGDDLRVKEQTTGAADALLRLNPPDEPMAPIPAAAYNIGAALVAEEAGVPVGPPWSRVHLGGSRWVSVKAARIGQHDIVASIEPSTPQERLDLYARCYGLSARETEVVALLSDGHESRAMAGQLFLSEHTVNDHVKSVLAKTGARTRQVMLSRALGR